MNIKTFDIDNRQIKIIKNFYLDKSDKELLYLTACNSTFKIKGKSAEDVQNRNNLKMESELNMETLNQINLFGGERKSFFHSELNFSEYEIFRAYINLGLISDYQEIHVDNYKPGCSKTLLVYCNRVWQENWGGETFFYSNDSKEIKYISNIEPGKAVVFDGTIPHMAKVQHNFCNNYRFTLAIKFVKRSNCFI